VSSETSPAPGAEHDDTQVDPEADTSQGTGAAPEHVPEEDLEDDDGA